MSAWRSASRRLILLYATMSIVYAVGAIRYDSVTSGLCIFGASTLAIMAGAGLRASLEGDRAQKIAGPVITALLLALAWWLSMRSSWNIFGHQLSGSVWMVIGFILFCAAGGEKSLEHGTAGGNATMGE
jgi:hypothetical protein